MLLRHDLPLLLTLACSITLAGCPKPGTEGHNCREGDSCDAELHCLSGKCVKLPAAVCAALLKKGDKGSARSSDTGSGNVGGLGGALLKYRRKAMTTEAVQALDRIKTGARAFFQADHYDNTGSLLPKKFPASTEWTPSKTCCKEPGGTCASDSSAWQAAGWKGLHMALTDPHRYQYRFTSKGQGQAAVFTATARGDLDCDGTWSSYSIRGRVDSEFAVVTVGPIITDELE